MRIILSLIPFLILTQASETATDLDPIFRQDGFTIPGFDGVCSIISSKCTAQSTDCMTARCNAAKGNVCFGEGKEYGTYCQDQITDSDDEEVTVPGICVEGACVHVGDAVQCPEGQIVAYRTFPSCGDVSFGTNFRFKTPTSFVVIGTTEQSFGPDLEYVKSTTAQTINDPGYGVAKVRYLDMSYGDCIVGHDSSCRISQAGTYNLMGMSITWQPSSGNAESRESTLEVKTQTIELKPEFYCDTDACRTEIQVKASSPTPCGDTQLICEDPCKWRISGFTTHTDLNGDWTVRGSDINGFPSYAKENDVYYFAKSAISNQWWFDDDLSDYQTASSSNFLASLEWSATQNPMDSSTAFQVFEKIDSGDVSTVINVRQTCGSNDPGPCGPIDPLFSTHKYWSVAYGTVHFNPPDITDAYVKENPSDPYNIALLGDVNINAAQVEFEVEVTFKGQMAGILAFGTDNSYVMCRLDSATGAPGSTIPTTGVSIIRYPNTWVVNGHQTYGYGPNAQNEAHRLKITVHNDVVTCYLNDFSENAVELPRVTGTYSGTHVGRVGFLTFNAEASFRILGCPIQGPGPIDPPVNPCVPVDSNSNSNSNSVSNSVSMDDSIDSADGSTDGGDSIDGGDSFDGGDSGDGGNPFANRNRFGGGSDSAETEIGDSGEIDDGIDSTSDSQDGSTSISASDSEDSSEPREPDDGTCVDSGSNSVSGSASDSFDVELAIGVQTESLSNAVLKDDVIYVLASVGLISSLFMMYRFMCSKGDYEVVAEPSEL